MVLKMKRKSLAEKINNLLTPTPANLGSDDEEEETKAKVVEHYDESDHSDDDFRQSQFRRQNVPLLDQEDKRYEGKKISRKDIYNQDDDSVLSSGSDAEKSAEISVEEGDSDIEQDTGVEEEFMKDDDSDAEKSAEISVEEGDSDIEQDTGDEEEFMKDDDDDDEETDRRLELEEEEDKSDDEAEEEEEEDDYSITQGDSSHAREESDDKIKTMTSTNVNTEIEKGNCVRNQLKIWENLLEFRIKLQKCLVTSNKMPQPEVYKQMKTDKEFVKKTTEVKNNFTTLLDNMLELQKILILSYPETKNLDLTNKKQKVTKNDKKDESAENKDGMDEEIPSDTEDEMQKETEASDAEEVESKEDAEEVPRKKRKLSDYEEILAARHECYRDYRNSVIQKWNDKTRVASGVINKGPSVSIVKQIEFALNDKAKLRKRTQLKRSEYTIVGKQVPTEENDGRRVQEYDPEIYDDDDFYHQLLRDLIEYKSSDVTDPIQLSKQWVQLQNMRSKLKRKIDTRATKGRRIRYNVHNKLVNFMAPITVNDTWTDHAKTELYKSLFGKIKPVEDDTAQ